MNDYADSHGICFTKDQLVILHYSCEMYLVCVLFHFIFFTRVDHHMVLSTS